MADGGRIIELDVTGRNFNRDIQFAIDAIENRLAFAIIMIELLTGRLTEITVCVYRC
ncbi:hypothetical protein AB0B89_12625 [Sphaerisporangium sp. NPDC049002]|uniref:hypothetical protein n=1 Tax=unclassified Sphaerisporangium TaxID=2630420 RepID=UPI003410B9BE